jgi:osmoprotectant transport system permease protein
MWTELLGWFRETDDIGRRVIEHLWLSFTPVIAAAALMLPLGLYIGHRRRFELLATTIANIGRAVPSFGVLALALPLSIRFGWGLGFWPAFAALLLLSLPPILTNTYVGVKDVEAEAVEAARGMGLTELQVVKRVEAPLALPLILAGLRIAALQSVATATIAALVAGPGLGVYIFFGFRAQRPGPLLGGAILVAALALITELAFGTITRLVSRRDHAGGWAVPGAAVEPAQVGRPGGLA